MPVLDFEPPAISPPAEPAGWGQTETGEVAANAVRSYRTGNERWEYTSRHTASYTLARDSDTGAVQSLVVSGSSRYWFVHWQGEVVVDDGATEVPWGAMADGRSKLDWVRGRPDYDGSQFPIAVAAWETMTGGEKFYDTAAGYLNGRRLAFSYSATHQDHSTVTVTPAPAAGGQEKVEVSDGYNSKAARAWQPTVAVPGTGSLTLDTTASGTSKTTVDTKVVVEGGQVTARLAEVSRTGNGTSKLDYEQWSAWVDRELVDGFEVKRFNTRVDDAHHSSGGYTTSMTGDLRSDRDPATGPLGINFGTLTSETTDTNTVTLEQSTSRVDYRFRPLQNQPIRRTADGFVKTTSKVTDLTTTFTSKDNVGWLGRAKVSDNRVDTLTVNGTSDRKSERDGTFSEARGGGHTNGGLQPETFVQGQAKGLETSKGPFGGRTRTLYDRHNNSMQVDDMANNFATVTVSDNVSGSGFEFQPTSEEDGLTYHTEFKSDTSLSGSDMRTAHAALGWRLNDDPADGLPASAAGTSKANTGTALTGTVSGWWKTTGPGDRTPGGTLTPAEQASGLFVRTEGTVTQTVTADNSSYEADLVIRDGSPWSGKEVAVAGSQTSEKTLLAQDHVRVTKDPQGKPATTVTRRGEVDHKWDWTTDTARLEHVYTDGGKAVNTAVTREGNGDFKDYARVQVEDHKTTGLLVVTKRVNNKPTAKFTVTTARPAGGLTNGSTEGRETNAGDQTYSMVYTEDLAHRGPGVTGSVRISTDSSATFSDAIGVKVPVVDGDFERPLELVELSGKETGRADHKYDRTQTTVTNHAGGPNVPGTSTKATEEEHNTGWDTWDNEVSRDAAGGSPPCWRGTRTATPRPTSAGCTTPPRRTAGR